VSSLARASPRFSLSTVVGAGLFALVAGVLASTCLLTWYQIGIASSGQCGVPGPAASSATGTTFETYYLYGVSLPNLGSFGAAPTAPVTYASAFQPATGTLYLLVLLLVVGSIAAAGFGVFSLVRSRPHRRAVLLAGAVVVLVGLAAPTVLAEMQPSALCSDAGHGPGGGACTWPYPLTNGTAGLGASNGPQLSFYGNVPNPGGCGVGAAWGPGPAWYLAWLTAPLGVAALVLGGRVPAPPPPPPRLARAPHPPAAVWDFSTPVEAYTPRRPD
jgi:hypothetical protein